MNQTAAISDKSVKVRVGIRRGGVDGIDIRTYRKRYGDLEIGTVAEGCGGGDGIIATQTGPNLDEIVRVGSLWRVAGISALGDKVEGAD